MSGNKDFQRNNDGGSRRQYDICLDDDGVILESGGHWRRRLTWRELDEVGVMRHVEGSRTELFMILLGHSLGTSCFIPGHSRGMDRLWARLCRLPGFDERGLEAALAGEGRGTCWRRDWVH